jgi:hypothetical protein
MKGKAKNSGFIHHRLKVSGEKEVPSNELIDCFIETDRSSVKVKVPQGSSKVVPRNNPIKKARKIKAIDFESDDE